MTPEQLKSTCNMFQTELKAQGASMGIMSVFDSMCSYLGGESRDLNKALAALEETQQEYELMKFDRDILVKLVSNHQSAVDDACSELVEAQQTISRQSEALGWYELGKSELARAALGNKKGEKTDESHNNS